MNVHVVSQCVSYFLFDRYSSTKAIVIAMICTFFEALNIPVFWPILVMYFIILFVITMKRQIKVRINISNINLSPEGILLCATTPLSSYKCQDSWQNIDLP